MSITRLDYQFRDYRIGQAFLKGLGFWVYWSSRAPYGFGWVNIDETIMKPEDRIFFSTNGNSPVVANLNRDGRLHGIWGQNPVEPYSYYENLIIDRLERLQQPS